MASPCLLRSLAQCRANRCANGDAHSHAKRKVAHRHAEARAKGQANSHTLAHGVVGSFLRHLFFFWLIHSLYLLLQLKRAC
jgi:hypothetical protein